MTFFKIVQIPIFQTQRLLPVGPTLASGARPGRAGQTALGLARDTFESRAETRRSLRDSNLTDRRPSPVFLLAGRLPGLA